jgi:hypothetical protein
MTLYSFVYIYQRLGGTCTQILWRWKQKIPPKRLYVPDFVMSPHKLVLVATLSVRILVVAVSNLGQSTECPYWGFSLFCSVPQSKCKDSSWTEPAPLPPPPESSPICWSSYHSTLCSLSDVVCFLWSVNGNGHSSDLVMNRVSRNILCYICSVQLWTHQDPGPPAALEVVQQGRARLKNVQVEVCLLDRVGFLGAS